MNQNIIFYLTFKKDLQFLYDSLSLADALKLIRRHGYTALPVIDSAGRYVGTLSEGDLLWFMLDHRPDRTVLEETSVRELIRPDFMPAVNIALPVDTLLNMSLHQNFIPVVDDRDIFIGIVTRQSILRAFKKAEEKLPLNCLSIPSPRAGELRP